MVLLLVVPHCYFPLTLLLPRSPHFSLLLRLSPDSPQLCVPFSLSRESLPSSPQFLSLCLTSLVIWIVAFGRYFLPVTLILRQNVHQLHFFFSYPSSGKALKFLFLSQQEDAIRQNKRCLIVLRLQLTSLDTTWQGVMS